jgi:uncharacterized protein (TIGR02172 family)
MGIRPPADLRREFIAEGRTAEVYAWGDHEVLKLYHSWWPLRNIEYEIRICRAVHDAGIPSPAVGDLIELDGRYALIYERIDGPSMQSLVFADTERVDEMARLFAHLQASLHATSGTTAHDLPSQRQRLTSHIELAARSLLDETRKQYALNILSTLPDGNSLCHGDLYPANVLVSSAGLTIIDWENASIGSPLADVARTLLAYTVAPLYAPSEPYLGPLLPAIASFKDLYLETYLAETGADIALINAWAIPIAAGRLHEGIEVEEEYLKNVCTPR